MLHKHFYHQDKNKGHVKSLDGLRGLAILIVLFAHGADFGFSLPIISNINKTGHTGVFLFFILSAYLLDKNIASKMVNKTDNYVFWTDYFFRRFLRIMPMFTISLLLYFFLSHYTESFIRKPSDILDHLLFLKAEFMYWSIPVEFIFYLISPVILVICAKVFRWNQISTSLFLFLIICSSVLYSYFNFDLFSTLNYLPIFTFGTGLALFEILNPRISFNKKKLDLLGFLSLFIFVIIVFVQKTQFPLTEGFNYYEVTPIYALFIVVFLYSAVNGLVFKRFFELKVMRFFGVISFSLYLLHLAVVFILKEYSTGFHPIDILLYYGGSVMIATLGYILIEKPLSKFRFVPVKQRKQIG